MIRISGNTVIPIVTWANTPPHHQITSILVSEDAEYVATGSADGNIIIWDLGNSCICTPRWMLTGHKSLVSNLCNAGRSPMSNNQFFFSYSINGEMAVWNWSDGKCLEFKMDTRYRHTYIKSHKTCFLDYRLLFCCGQYPHIVVLHATSLTVLFTLASNSQPDWISSFVVVTNPNQRSEIVLGLSFSNVATLWTLDGEEIQGEAKYEHESRSINCPSTVLQVVCCPQTPRCILLVCSTGWQLFNAMTCSIICTISNPANDTLVGGGFITSNVISVFGRSGFAYLYCLPKSLIVQSGESVCSDVPVHIATLSPHHANNIHNNNNNRSSNGEETVDRNPTNTVQNFSCFTPAFIHPSDDFQYMIAGTIHGQLLAWRIQLDAYLSNIDHQIGSNEVSSRRSISTIPPWMSSDLHSVWKRYTPPDIATFLTSSITGPKYHTNLMNNPTLSSSSPASLLPPDSSTQMTPSPALPDTSEEKISVTVCIQLTQIICHHRLPDRRPTIHPYRLAFGLSNGRIIIVRMVDFLKTLYWEKSHTTDENNKPSCEESPLLLLNQHNRLLSKFCLTGHIGPVTSLLHPASYERQFYANSGNMNENTMPTTTSNDVGNSSTTSTSTTNNVNSSIMNSTTNYHFNPDHLLSGGVDCTVRLWDLNPWHESMNSRKFSSSNNSYNANNSNNTNASRSNKSLCLAVYRCHASPCIGLTIAPPITSVINMVAGNPRLSACICSFSLDGSVWLINLKEQRPILYARNTSSVALCPVVAIGWRVAEDLLFIAYLDGSVTIWDITMGCLERTETDQSARDLFEQAQFITEVYHPSRYLAFSFSTLPSVTISTYKSRSLACLPSHNSIYTSLAVPFCGGVNSAYSSGCVAFTAPSRLKYSSIDNIHKLCMNCLPPIQLHLIGSTHNGDDDGCTTSEKRLLNSGPAAFVFHWDIESLIVEILSQNNAVLKDNDESVNHNSAPSSSASSSSSAASLYHDDIFTIDVTQANFIQLILSLIHPWGIDSSVDKIVEKLCNNQFIKMMPELNSSSVHHYQSPLLHIQESLCIGLISKCGCMSLSMPGCIASKSQHLKSKSISSIPNAYCLSSIISTNLLLCGVTLTELMTSLNYKYLQRLSHTICLTTTSPSSSGSLISPTSTSLLPSFLSSSSSLPNGGNLPKTLHNDWRKNWLQFCAFLLDHFINLILSNRSVINNTESTSHGENALPSIDLNLFIRKWQDRCLPIRYAARTLLLTCLDRLSSEDRKLLVAYWSALLPPFSLTTTKDYPQQQQQQQQQQQPLPSRQMIHQQVSLDRTNINSNNTVGYITDILANHTELKSTTTTRKQSLPQVMNGLINTEPNHFPAAPNGDMKKQINSSNNNGIVDELNQLPVDNSTLLSIGRQSSVNKSAASSAPIQLDTLPAMTESVSMTSLNSNLNLSLVLDSSWWMTLNGYRVSPRENARLQRDIQRCQAMAIVLMGVIGMRFGSSGNSTRNTDNSSNNNDDNNNRQYHPAVVARDLITSPLIPNHQDKTTEMMADNLNYGLTLPRFTSSSSLSASSSLNASCLSLENFTESSTTTATTHQQSYEIQDGFGLDNYYLARSTCQCLTALLFNGGYPTLLPTDGSYPEVNWRKLNEQIVGSHVEPLPVYAANALITLLTSNVNSTLRRAAIDLLGRGFPVWEPYVDVGQVINALLLLAADAELLMSSDASRLLLSDRVDLARTAREALWAIAFARPKVITLALSLEVRRYGAQIYAAASASSSTSSSSINRVSVPSQSNLTNQMWNRSNSLSRDLDHLANNNTTRRDSVTAGNELHSSSLSSSNMVVMMSGPTVATPVFSPNNAVNRTTTGHGGGDMSAMHNSNCPPMFKAREEVLRLFEQLCIRRPSDIKDVLPEVVEVILACSDRTRLKERGLDYVFPALTPFHSYSSHTRLQKVCTGGVNGSLTFYDFKIGRYFVTMAHKGPVTAVCFHSDGRQVATYSLTESTLRIWQLHTTGFFGMGGQQVKALSLHPVPPLVPPPPPTPKLSTASSHKESVDNQQQQQQHQSSSTLDRLQVWIDWPESRVLHLITNTGIKRRVAL
ncbi:unnamed protein product [Trichobilharzia szidati]|nr:unnamed protein product [Trichobilharzia szidati]